jgi:hypothetical protein
VVGRLVITDWNGKTAHYARRLHLEGRGGSDVKLAFAVGVISCNEAAVRSVPERIDLLRQAETHWVTGVR